MKRICLGLCLLALQLQAHAYSEDYVKAASLIYLAQNITWPDKYPDEPVTVCLTGSVSDGLYSEMNAIAAASGSRLMVEQHAKPLNRCHILFVTKPKSYGEPLFFIDLLLFADKYSLLTVSDQEAFCLNSGMIQLYTDKNTVKFLINYAYTLHSGIQLSPELIQNALLIHYPEFSPRGMLPQVYRQLPDNGAKAIVPHRAAGLFSFTHGLVQYEAMPGVAVEWPETGALSSTYTACSPWNRQNCISANAETAPVKLKSGSSPLKMLLEFFTLAGVTVSLLLFTVMAAVIVFLRGLSRR